MSDLSLTVTGSENFTPAISTTPRTSGLVLTSSRNTDFTLATSTVGPRPMLAASHTSTEVLDAPVSTFPFTRASPWWPITLTYSIGPMKIRSLTANRFTLTHPLSVLRYNPSVGSGTYHENRRLLEE